MYRCFQQPEVPLIAFTVGQKMVKPTCAGGALTAYLMLLLKMWRLSHFLLLVDFFIAIIFDTRTHISHVFIPPTKD